MDHRPLHERLGMSAGRLQILGVVVSLAVLGTGALIWEMRPTIEDEIAQPVPGAPVARPMVREPDVATQAMASVSTTSFEPVTALDATRAGNAAFSTGDFGASKDAYEKALEKNPEDPDALNGLGQALDRLGRVSEAIPKFERAVVLNPQKWAYRFNLAHALGQLAQWEAAVVQYREAQHLFPDDYATQYNLAMALHKKGDEQAAIPEFEKAIALAPSESTFHISLGISLEKAGRVQDAIREYNAYLEMEPSAPDSGKLKAHVAALTAS